MDYEIGKPRVVAFEATGKCKMHCKHCRASAESNFADDLSTNDCKKIIKAVADYNRCVFIFTGGEPFERADIFELIEYANSCGLATSVATCGYDFDLEKAQRLKKLGVLTLSFSLDSDAAKVHDEFRQTKGAFEKTMAAIEIAKEAGLKFQINTTVTKFNSEKLPALAQIAEKAGAYCFNPFMLVPAGRAREISDIALSAKEYEKTLRIAADLKAVSKIEVRFTCAPRFAAVFSQAYPESKKKAFGCLAANDFAFVSRTGDVQTCGFLKISAGNILKIGNFGDIWEHSKLLNSIRAKNFAGKCGGCEHVQICGGCRARAFAQSGDYMGSDPLCSFVGEVSTLAAAHIEDDRIEQAAEAINSLGNVSHNYLRKHHFNLWFTLKSGNVNAILKELSEKFNTEFYSFPSTVRYKVDSKAVKRHNPPENYNALVCLRAGGAAAKFLCDLPQVSHCYERQTLPDWPYNVYAMIHEKSIERIEQIVAKIVSEFGISKFQILPTVKSLK
ncbi:MAG: radical SAM protein [Phycisphaerales bacterium]